MEDTEQEKDLNTEQESLQNIEQEEGMADVIDAGTFINSRY